MHMSFVIISKTIYMDVKNLNEQKQTFYKIKTIYKIQG